MFIYLDQSDWAMLHAGRAQEAEAALREMGERGDATYVVSSEHMLETHKLGRGRGDRLAFLRRFPGVAFTGNVTDALLAADASRLAGHVEGHSPVPTQLEIVRVSELSDDEFAQLAGPGHWIFRLLHRFTLVPERIGRAARRGETKKARRGSDAAVRAFLRGDAAAFGKAIGALGPPVGIVRRRVFDTLAPVAARAGAWARAHGFAGPDKNRDPQFDRCVLPRLPEDVRRRPEVVQRCATLWADATTRGELVPSLAAYAAVHEALENDLARTLSAGDLVDARHAAYAPWADVFTCDKRNEAAVRRALASAARGTKVVRCARLTEVVKLARKSTDAER